MSALNLQAYTKIALKLFDRKATIETIEEFADVLGPLANHHFNRKRFILVATRPDLAILNWRAVAFSTPPPY